MHAISVKHYLRFAPKNRSHTLVTRIREASARGCSQRLGARTKRAPRCASVAWSYFTPAEAKVSLTLLDRIVAILWSLTQR
jgi:hypothetical protein